MENIERCKKSFSSGKYCLNYKQFVRKNKRLAKVK